MQISLTMPQFGESITQSRIVRWLKKEGDNVSEGEALVEMETEKSVFSYESPFKGKLSAIIEKEDREVSVGNPIAQFDVADADGKKYLALGVGKIAEASKTAAPVSTPTPAPEAPVTAKPTSAAAASNDKTLSPLIRSLAKENKISFEEVLKISGTGPGGRITKSDFEMFLGTRGGQVIPPSPSVVTETPKEGITQIPLSAIRSRIADNMILSKQTIPHAGTGLDVNLIEIDRWRKKEGKGRYTYLPFILWAVVKSLKEFPVINSVLKESQGKRWIEQRDFVNLGIAVSSEQGLLVTVIHKADQLNFSELSKEMDRLVEEGRKGNLKPQELSGGTFTINNTGSLGAIRSLQVIPPTQSATLAVNRVVKRPWVEEDDQIAIRPILSLDMAFDHRIIDGEQAVKFLVTVREKLENFDFSVV